MWAWIFRIATVAAPIVADLSTGSGSPSWLSTAGLGAVSTFEMAKRVKRKRDTGAPIFRTRK